MLEREPDRPRSLNAAIDRDLETICLKCLEQDPARRYPNCAELADDLQRWLDGEVIQARRARPGDRLGKWVRRRPALAAQARAEEQEELAQFHAYVNRVMRAHFEWKENEVARADQILEECPQRLRHWEWRYVKRLCHLELLCLKGHTLPVTSVCFSPDGKRIASAHSDRTVKVWDAERGQVDFFHTSSSPGKRPPGQP